MKNIKRLAAGAVLGLAICRFAIAQSPQGGATGHADGISAAQHIAEVFAKVAAFDRNKDGQLDATEKESLAKAIADGTLQLLSHISPHGEKPSAEMMLTHIAEMYAHVAKYDANHDGALDATEQTAVMEGIENGELQHLHGQHSLGALQHGAPAVKHMAEVFAKVSVFDRNKDGQLDATEKESLAKAIADGTLQLPAHTPPHGEKPNAEMILTHITEMYAHVAKYDANHDGALDEAEQTAITKAIEAGELHLPHGQHAHGGDQPQQ